MNKKSLMLMTIAGVLFGIAGILGSNSTFTVIGVVFIVIGIASFNWKKPSRD